jgi:hypothetical protein
LSYIFNEFSNGKAEGPSFSSVVKIAREKGYTVRHSPLLARSKPYRELRSHTLVMTSTARTSLGN